MTTISYWNFEIKIKKREFKPVVKNVFETRRFMRKPIIIDSY